MAAMLLEAFGIVFAAEVCTRGWRLVTDEGIRAVKANASRTW